MSLYNTLTGNTLKPGDIVITSPDNVNDKYIEMGLQKKNFDQSFAPKLVGLTNYLGNSGVTNLTFSEDKTDSLYTSITNVIIKRNDNESYLIGTSNGTGFRGVISRIDNNDIQNPVILQQNFVTGDNGKFLKFMPCIVEDKIHICYCDNDTAYYIVYDITNNTLSTERTIVNEGTTAIDPVCIRYIPFKNEIIIVLRIGANNIRSYTTVDGNSFVLENTYSVDTRYIDDYVNNHTYVKEGTMNFYDNKLWFFHLNNNFIFSINVNDFTYTNEFDISTLPITLSNNQYNYDLLSVTENGVFLGLLNVNSTIDCEIFYCNGDFSNSQINTQSISGDSFSLNMIDDNSAIFKYFFDNKNILLSSYNLSNQTDSFSFLYEYNNSIYQSKTGNISLTKDLDKLIIVTNKTSYSNVSIDLIEFDAIVSQSPVVIPVSPIAPNTQYKAYVYKG